MSYFPEHFERRPEGHLKYLKLKGLQPKTLDVLLCKHSTQTRGVLTCRLAPPGCREGR